jgi:hypothetical protein
VTPTLQAILDVSTRIREYEAAADTITAMARLATDVQVRASLQQLALELVQTAGQWRVRQDAELTVYPGKVPLPPSLKSIAGGAERVDGGEGLAPVILGGPPGGSYAKHIVRTGGSPWYAEEQKK